jgi:hypothetical protein
MSNEPRANHLLAALRPEELQRLQPHLEPAALVHDQQLCQPGLVVSHVHFPTTALVSLVCSTCAGDSIEVGMIGSDGVVGATFAVQDRWTLGRAVVQRAGGALRLPLRVLQREFARGGSLQLLTLRHGELLMAQVAQTALCSHRHRLDEQLCRWILSNLDRTGSARLEVTQQHVAGMLGVRREGVSTAVRRLQADGLLYWGRGRLQVADRAALESRCCECYGVLRTTSQRLFGLTPPPG